jgi:hypothetical protein
MAIPPAPFLSLNWKIAYQAGLLEYRSDGSVGAKLGVAVSACINTLQNLTDHTQKQERCTVSAALIDMLVLRRSSYHTQNQNRTQRIVAKYPWEEPCLAALGETDKSSRFVRVYDGRRRLNNDG